jgi:hypothetical protein
MHTGLKFTDANGVTRTVSPANPLPISGTVTGAGDSSAANQITMIELLEDIKAELIAQTALLDDIKANTTPSP